MKQRILKTASIITALLSLMLCACNAKPNTTKTPSDADKSNGSSGYKIVFVQYDNSYRENEMRENFISRMRLLGYDEIKLKTDVKNARCDQNKLVEIIKELKTADYDLIVTIGNESSIEASKAQLKVPCVFIGAENPIESGILKNVDSPDKNITGTVMNTSDKRTASLIRIFTPEVKTVGIMVSADNNAAIKNAESFRDTANAEGISAEIYKIESIDKIEEETTNIITQNDAVFIPEDGKLNYYAKKIVEIAAAENKFVFSSSVTAVKSGALAAYCSSPAELSGNAAVIADEILRGKRLSEIPVDFSVEGNIFLSSQTYSRLGIGVPDIDGLVVI